MYVDVHRHELDPILGALDPTRQVGEVELPFETAWTGALLVRQHEIEGRMARLLGVDHPGEFPLDADE
jgi:hypothetical protein